MPAPFAYPTNVTQFGQLFTYANSVTGDLFGMLILFGIWVIFFLAFQKGRPSHALTAASYLTLVLGVFLWSFGIVGATPIIVLVVATLVSTLWLVWSSGRGG